MAGQRPGGIGQYFDGAIGDPGRILIKEVHVSTCNHCGHQTEFESRRVMMEHVEICRGCMKLICLGCAGGPCIPQEKWAEMKEAEERVKRRLEMSAWRCY